MERYSVGEREAFELLRTHSRRTGRKLVDVAAAVVDVHHLLPGQAPGSASRDGSQTVGDPAVSPAEPEA